MHAGVPCSSYVWISLSTSKRKADNDFWGDESRAFIRQANKLTCRALLLLLLCTARGVWWVVEQPSSSRLNRIPSWVLMSQLVGAIIPVTDVRLPGPQNKR